MSLSLRHPNGRGDVGNKDEVDVGLLSPPKSPEWPMTLDEA